MIDAKQIMIGNWFSHNENWNYCGHKGYFKFSESDWYAIGECTLFLEDADYIPLSEEILLKCGFEKLAFSFNCERFHMTKQDDTNKWFLAFNKNNAFICTMRYLHELQNLYYLLTKQELEIKL